MSDIIYAALLCTIAPAIGLVLLAVVVGMVLLAGWVRWRVGRFLRWSKSSH